MLGQKKLNPLHDPAVQWLPRSFTEGDVGALSCRRRSRQLTSGAPRQSPSGADGRATLFPPLITATLIDAPTVPVHFQMPRHQRFPCRSQASLPPGSCPISPLSHDHTLPAQDLKFGISWLGLIFPLGPEMLWSKTGFPDIRVPGCLTQKILTQGSHQAGG